MCRIEEWRWHLYPKCFDLMNHVFEDRIFQVHVMIYLLTNGYNSRNLLKSYSRRNGRVKYAVHALYYSIYHKVSYGFSYLIFEDDNVVVLFVHDIMNIKNENAFVCKSVEK